VQHVGYHNFGPVVERAKQLPGFTAEDAAAEGPKHLVGFGRETMLGAAPAVRLLKASRLTCFGDGCCPREASIGALFQVLDAIKEGKLSHIFLIGGCDGSEGTRR